MPARLLLLCLLSGSSWLTVEGNRHLGVRECCIAGADGQPWLVAFQNSSVGRPDSVEPRPGVDRGTARSLAVT